MKTSAGKTKTSKKQRRIRVTRIDHGHDTKVDVWAISLRDALETHFEHVLKREGHHKPLYVGNTMYTLTRFFTKAEYVAHETDGS